MQMLKKHWPLYLALAVLCAIVAVLLVVSIQKNDGKLIYAIDDPYIHMAIAKNLTAHGVWGPTPHEFASASSSIIWTLLIAASFLLCGANELSPFVFAFLSAAALLVVAYRILKRYGAPQYIAGSILLALIFITPVPLLIFSGMEHLLHATLTILLVFCAAPMLSGKQSDWTPSQKRNLLIAAALAVGVRYESLVLIGMLSLLFVIKKKPVFGIMLACASLLIVLPFGLYATVHGGFLLPNSVLVKSLAENGLAALGMHTLLSVFFSPFGFFVSIVIFFAAIVAMLRKRPIRRSKYARPALLFIGIAMVHITLARVDWIFRYSAFLVALGIVTIGILLIELFQNKTQFSLSKNFTFKKTALVALLIVLIAPLVYIRGVLALFNTVLATTSIYKQQYQMGLFIKKFYPSARIAAHDIGAISYLSDARLLDLNGLGTTEIARLRVGNNFTESNLQLLSRERGIQIAIAYQYVFFQKPDGWIEVGAWQHLNNTTAMNDTVTFYATTGAAAEQLTKNLQAFSPLLPDAVIESGTYIPAAAE
ncbi:MAG: hypothetical protein WC505_07395 [Patescibacteria group bacterium]